MMTASHSLDITYVPADCGSVIPGKSKAPKAFQDVGIASKLSKAGVTSVSEHDALGSPSTFQTVGIASSGVRNEEANVKVCQKVCDCITKNLETTSDNPPFQLIIGGECCMLPGIMTALWQYAESRSSSSRVGLIYIDADLDLSSPTDSNTTGNFAGMNMTHLLRTSGALESMKPFTRASGKPVCGNSNTAFFGVNMANPGNKRDHLAYLFDNDFSVRSSAAVAFAPEKVAQEVITFMADKCDTILVHLDVDSIDPQTFPLANVPNHTGVTFQQMMSALKVFLSSDRVAGLCIAEVNPDHDVGLRMIEELTDEVVAMMAARK